MCGILFSAKVKSKQKLQQLSEIMKHRGPDQCGTFVSKEGFGLFHQRLSIMDTSGGRQPIQGKSEAQVIHNGEIYNHSELHQKYFPDEIFRTSCDSEIIVRLYEKFGNDFCTMLDGVFAFAVATEGSYMVARDPIGVKPLYWGKDKDGILHFASEVKAIAEICPVFSTFPPGNYFTPATGFIEYYKPQWANLKTPEINVDYITLREKLEKSVKKRLMSDVPLGVLLSGGLDSSLVASIAAREMKNQGRKLHSFSVGIIGSPDLLAAKRTADFLGTIHHEINFTPKEGLKILKRLIYHLESYDVTTIRASTPMFLLSQEIVKTGIKVVLSGEGADEIFGGYLYFENAPNLKKYRKETVERVKRLSKADCLRADKSTMAHGLEARVPFLDLDFLAYTMQISATDKKQNYNMKKPEKYILRKAFDDKENPYLPTEILWRQKEQFSDGVGYSWIDELVEFCEYKILDVEFSQAKKQFPHNTPNTKEAFYFRKLFSQFYPQKCAAQMVEKWEPKWQKNKDPSGRANVSHELTYDKNKYLQEQS